MPPKSIVTQAQFVGAPQEGAVRLNDLLRSYVVSGFSRTRTHTSSNVRTNPRLDVGHHSLLAGVVEEVVVVALVQLERLVF
jgi:hypothetical protein